MWGPGVFGTGIPPHDNKCEKTVTTRMTINVVSRAAQMEMMIPANAIPSPASPVVRICERAMNPHTIPAGQNTNAATKETTASVFVLAVPL